MEHLYIFDATGAIAASVDSRPVIPQALVNVVLADHPGCVAYISTENLGLEVSATIENGEVVSVAASPVPVLLCDITVSGGDGNTPPGIINDDSDSFEAHIKLTDQEGNLIPLVDPETKEPLPETERTWRVTSRDQDGNIHDVVEVVLNPDGQVVVDYTTDRPPARCHMDDRDLGLETVMGYQVKLARPVNWVVKRKRFTAKTA